VDLLRFATAGSVDDGKSTLIGRLLHDSKQIFEDQLAAVAASSRRRGHEGMDLALLTDGLRAEREQGITIDVAYRYFATPNRKFIIADTPGHAQYTRNMVTGASTADLAVVLVDATHGLREQSRRHAYVASLLGIRHVVLAVNKMDLVGWSESVFDDIVAAFLEFSASLDLQVTPIPMSALRGDNVVDPSDEMPWYKGPALLSYLENVRLDDVAPAAKPGRFPIQWIVKPLPGSSESRGYAGSIASGVFAPGDEVVILPGGLRTRIASIATFDGALDSAAAPRAICMSFVDELDVGRGDLVAPAGSRPEVTDSFDATVCWMDGAPLRAGARYLLKHTTRTTPVVVRELVHRTDVDTLAPEPAETLDINEIGLVRLQSATDLALDPYREHRTTGSFILIDDATNATVGAGLVR
jgi:bifunctional enzyme CysN/CysC